MEVEFSRSRNDLFWRCYCPVCYQNNYTFTTLRWTGYDDDHWWNNIAPKRSKQTCPICKTMFRLDFETNKVEECKETDDKPVAGEGNTKSNNIGGNNE